MNMNNNERAFENERYTQARKARAIANRLLRENMISLEEWESLYNSAVYAETCATKKTINIKL